MLRSFNAISPARRAFTPGLFGLAVLSAVIILISPEAHCFRTDYVPHDSVTITYNGEPVVGNLFIRGGRLGEIFCRIVPLVSIPKPVVDDCPHTDSVTFAEMRQLAALIGFPDSLPIGFGSTNNIQADSDRFPSPTDTVVADRQPVFLSWRIPPYPRLARQAGITGTVTVKALVDKRGKVADAMIGKSSGTAALDGAAVEAARGNEFIPAMRKGQPIFIWIEYTVEFDLEG